MLPLSSTPNKEAIRQKWDKPIISRFCKLIHKKRLAYFGLPGPDIRDFSDWKQYLGWKTGIEVLSRTGNAREEQLRRINELQANVMLNGLSDDWELRRGILEDIVLDGVDIDGNKPALLLIENKRARMEYDLHNWDFQGGLGYRTNRGEVKRVEAIKRCIELQKDHPFIFLLTLNVRHTLGDELSTYLKGTATEIPTQHERTLRWYSDRGASDKTEHYRIKAVVPLFVRQFAHVNSLDCYCYPPVYYEGYREHLLHFVFTLIPKGTILPSFSQQQIRQVIDLPLIEALKGEFVLSPEQHPGLDRNRAYSELASHGLPYTKSTKLGKL